MLDYGKSCDSSFPFTELLPSLILRCCLTHSTRRFRTSLHRARLTYLARKVLSWILDVPRERLQTRRSSSTSGVRIGRRTRSNARSNQRRMDHLLLSARSQPPSPSRQITTSPLAHHSGTKSRRSLLFWFACVSSLCHLPHGTRSCPS